jgi:hypothetical protein
MVNSHNLILSFVFELKINEIWVKGVPYSQAGLKLPTYTCPKWVLLLRAGAICDPQHPASESARNDWFAYLPKLLL